MARHWVLGLGGLWLRLALAFLLVAVTALVVDTVLTSSSIATDIAAVIRRQEVGVAHGAALTSRAVYQPLGWAHADLDPVFDLAERADAAIKMRDQSGHVIGLSPGYATYPTAGEISLPIIARYVHGKAVIVGQITVRYRRRGFGALAKAFAAVRLQARIFAAIIAGLIALGVSTIAARLVIVPIEVMLTALRTRAAGDRDYRISRVRAPGVLRELLESFNESAEAFDAMDRAQRNLVADVSHELRTPLAILQVQSEILADGITEPTPENLASLHTEVLRLACMVDGLQRLAAATSAEMQLRRQRYDLAEIASEVAGRLDDAFASAGVTLSTRLEPAVALCDRDRIQDVVSNLLTNALKFTRAGGRVTVRTRRGDDHQAIVQVSDTGIGIPADELPQVTERFFRGQRSACLAGGSGIGMAIVSELVRAHHGHLDISSEEGQGTQVTVTLPTGGS